MERKDLNIKTSSHGWLIIMGQRLYNIHLYACTSGALMCAERAVKSL